MGRPDNSVSGSPTLDSLIIGGFQSKRSTGPMSPAYYTNLAGTASFDSPLQSQQ